MKIDADGIDQYVGRVGIGAALAGAAMIFGSGGMGAMILAAGGILAMAMSGLTTSRLRKRASRRITLAKRVDGMLKDLQDD